jgi:toxin ParE1/3/4
MSGRYEESEYVFCDLQDGFRYLRKYDRTTAEAFLEAAYDTFEFLAANPGLGRLRPEFGHVGLRSWRVHGFRRYLIFYRERPGNIQIWRVLHGTRDLSRILGPTD